MMTSATGVGLLRLFDRFRFLAGEQAVSSIVRMIGCAICALPTRRSAGTSCWPGRRAPSPRSSTSGVALWDLAGAACLQGFTLIGPTSEGLPGVWRFAWPPISGTLDVGFTHVLTLVVGAVLGPAQAALWRVSASRWPTAWPSPRADGAGPLSRTGQDARLWRRGRP
jgi:hypothetical protein